jgi:hypothetical protein
MQNINEAKRDLERLLQEFARTPTMPRLEGDLSPNEPVLLLIDQGRCERICRAGLFCPFSGCDAPIKSNGTLLTHLNRMHSVTNQCCRDLMHHFLHRLCPIEVHLMLSTNGSQAVDRH